jgi:hypothetical protein
MTWSGAQVNVDQHRYVEEQRHYAVERPIPANFFI